MAEKAKPQKRVRFNLPPNPSAGTSAGGGGGGSGGDGAAAPASAPRREPPSSPPRSPSPPQPFTYLGDGGGGDGAAAPASAPRRKPPSSPPRSPSPPQPFTYLGDGGGGDGPAAPASAPRREPLSSPPRSPSPPQPFTYFGDGGGGDGAAAPASAPRREPPSSPPRSPSPPQPFTYNPGAGSSGGGGAAGPKLCYSDSKDSEDEKPDEFKTKHGWGSLFISDLQVLPDYIGRQNCDPISTRELLSLRHNWKQLLDGKKTYLCHYCESIFADSTFVTPEPLGKALLCQEPLSHLVRGGKGQPITQQKFKILSEHYVCFRAMRRDGSEFYRAFLFSYLENLGKMQGSQAEVTRLMECVARSRVNFRRLKWNSAYFSNPEAFFSSVLSEFEHLVNSVANGLNADELYKISLQEISSSRIICLLRLLTEVHIRTYEADYNRAMSPIQNEKLDALLFCKESVRPFGADVSLLQMKALSQALGIPLHLALVDSTMIGRTVQVKCLDIIPQSGPLSSTRSYYLSSATDKQSFLPPGNLFLSDRMPLVTILETLRATGILYRN